MASIRRAGAVLAAGAVFTTGLMLLSGCGKSRRPAARPAPQPSVAAAQQMRDRLMRGDPNARIGIVYAADPAGQLVGVRDTAAGAFNEGDLVQFLDPSGNVIGSGTVVRLKNDAVHIQYAAEGSRTPGVGDLAVRTGGTAGGAPAVTGAVNGAGADGAGMAPGDAAGGDASAPATNGGMRQGPGVAGGSRLPPRRPPTGGQPADAGAGAGDAGAQPAPAGNEPPPANEPPAENQPPAGNEPPAGNDPPAANDPGGNAGNQDAGKPDGAAADDKPDLNK